MRNRVIIYSLFLVITYLINCGCSNKQNINEKDNDSIKRDTLTAVTMYGPTTFFNYRGEDMGFDYENIKAFALTNDMVLKIKIAHNITELLYMVERGEAQVAAYPVPYIEEYKNIILHCGPREITWQVLVQKKGKDMITDVSQLIGKEIMIEENSKYQYRLENLNKELGGGIKIIPVKKDSIGEEDLISMVAGDEIPLTVIDSDIASINKDYYPELDISLKLSLEQYGSWGVAKNNLKLAEKINKWNNSINETNIRKEIYKKYFEESKKGIDRISPKNLNQYKENHKGAISSFDIYFKNAAKTNGIDWLLLAAVGYNESNFNDKAQSRYGAKGIMQIMNVAAISVNEDPDNLFIPEINIRTGAKVIKQLDNSFKENILDPEERIKFVLAAYNSGIGHIYDSMALAEKYGLDPYKWTGNVSETALLKSRPEYYNDPVVKHGYFRGRETVDFVNKVLETYKVFKEIPTSS